MSRLSNDLRYSDLGEFMEELAEGVKKRKEEDVMGAIVDGDADDMVDWAEEYKKLRDMVEKKEHEATSAKSYMASEHDKRMKKLKEYAGAAGMSGRKMEYEPYEAYDDTLEICPIKVPQMVSVRYWPRDGTQITYLSKQHPDYEYYITLENNSGEIFFCDHIEELREKEGNYVVVYQDFKDREKPSINKIFLRYDDCDLFVYNYEQKVEEKEPTGATVGEPIETPELV